MSLKAVKYLALNVSAATAELIKGILALYPQAQIIPRVVPLKTRKSVWKCGCLCVKMSCPRPATRSTI